MTRLIPMLDDMPEEPAMGDSPNSCLLAPEVPGVEKHMPTINRVMSLMPGFAYVFNHATFSNDYANRSVGVHLGYSPEEIRGFGDQMLMHLVVPEDHPALSEHMARIAGLEGEETVTLEYRVRTKTGEERWLRSVDTVFDRASDGSVLRHVGCASDVTTEKRALIRLAQINADLEDKVALRTRDLAVLNSELESRIVDRTHELQEAVDELEQLTYIATHDLKVPVNNLCRLSLMLQDSVHLLKEDQAEQVGWINECAGQLSAKIQGLVLVAQIRLSEGLPVTTLNLRDAARKAVDACENAMGADTLPVVVDVPPDISVQFARFELHSILASLIDNAVKYADPARPLEIAIKGKVENEKVMLSVRDNGTGLDEKRDIEKVFGLFQRAHKEPAGSGISLYCARRMMALRGGEITVKGQRGEGAEFKLKFPDCEVAT